VLPFAGRALNPEKTTVLTNKRYGYCKLSGNEQPIAQHSAVVDRKRKLYLTKWFLTYHYFYSSSVAPFPTPIGYIWVQEQVSLHRKSLLYLAQAVAWNRNSPDTHTSFINKKPNKKRNWMSARRKKKRMQLNIILNEKRCTLSELN
jgi:hypothetical protein